MVLTTDYGQPVRKSPSLHGRKSNPKFLGTAEAYFVSHIGPKFQISLIYAFISCPWFWRLLSKFQNYEEDYVLFVAFSEKLNFTYVGNII